MENGRKFQRQKKGPARVNFKILALRPRGDGFHFHDLSPPLLLDGRKTKAAWK